MTAVSFQVDRGAATGNQNSAITVGTTAPGAHDIQFCWNQTDALGKNITRKDLILALKFFRRAIEQHANVTFTTGVIGPP